MAGWAQSYIECLKRGVTVKFRPKGNSMVPRINSGDLVTVEPLKEPPAVGDIVLCKVNGKQYLHLVKAVNINSFQIGNNRGRINGWTHINNIFGICTKVEK